MGLVRVWVRVSCFVVRVRVRFRPISFTTSTGSRSIISNNMPPWSIISNTSRDHIRELKVQNSPSTSGGHRAGIRADSGIRVDINGR